MRLPTTSPSDHISDPPVGRDTTATDEILALSKQIAQHCAAYREPSRHRAFTQVANTLVPYLLLCAGMLAAASWGYVWLALPLALPAGGLLVRLFIIQHDCGHGSFLPSRAGNDRLGQALSLLTLTPYESWKRAHAQHHASTGDLSRRGTGDVATLTVREYLARDRLGRLQYRLYRNPLLLIGLGSPLNFLVLQRLPHGVGLPWRTACWDVLRLDLALAAFLGALVLVFGLASVLTVLVPTVCVAAWAGGWLFYVQHQYEDTTWEDAADWNFHRAALGGSSYYVLPKLLQWFTGNVGLHHIHHLNSRVPNYRLQECLDGHALLGRVGRLSLRESLGCVRLALWDENARKLVSFSHLRRSAAA